MASSQFLFKRRLEIQAQRFAAEFWEVFLAVVIAWKKSLPGNKSSAVQRQYQYTVPFWFQYLTLMCYIHIYTHFICLKENTNLQILGVLIYRRVTP